MATISHEIERLNAWVLDWIGNAFIHWHHQIFAGMRRKGMGKLQCLWQLALA